MKRILHVVETLDIAQLNLFHESTALHTHMNYKLVYSIFTIPP